jgi:hypothetical protein
VQPTDDGAVHHRQAFGIKDCMRLRLINLLTGEPILPAQTANQYLTNFTGANREPISDQILVRGLRR